MKNTIPNNFAKLERFGFDNNAIWKPLPEVVDDYLSIPEQERKLYSISSIEPVTFDIELPPHNYLNSDKIDRYIALHGRH